MHQEKKKIDKRIRKLQLRSELCAIEAEEVQELDVDFSKQFSQDFELEILFLEHKRNEQAKLADQRRVRPKAPKEGPAQTVEKKTDVETNEGLKKLHKQLAFELHPDRSKKEDHKEFLELQSAWERKEYERMLDISFKLDIDLQEILDADSVSMMERSLLERERKIQATKRNARWVWCQSNKSDKTRLLVRRALGVREQEFEAWLSKRTNEKNRTEAEFELNESGKNGIDGPPRKTLVGAESLVKERRARS